MNGDAQGSTNDRNELVAPALVVEGLQQRYGNFLLGPINVRFEAHINALIGPNGSGKSTFIETLIGLRNPRAGRAFMQAATNDHTASPDNGFTEVAYVADAPTDYQGYLTAVELWSMIAKVRERENAEDAAVMLAKAEELHRALNLADTHKVLRDCSFGTQRKIQLIGALMTTAQWVVLDEPQNGLDYISSLALMRILEERAATGVGVLMSNHNLDMVARHARSIHALRDGALVASFDATALDSDTIDARLRGVYEGGSSSAAAAYDSMEPTAPLADEDHPRGV